MTITCLKLTLVRRAQDDLNACSLMLGQSNRSTLNGTGKRQAVALAHALPPASSYTLVYSSDLSRALDTAAIVVAKSGGIIHRDARLRERHLGGRDGEIYRAQFKAALFEYSRGSGGGNGNGNGLENYAVPPDGESELDVRRRLADFFAHRLLPDLKASLEAKVKRDGNESSAAESSSKASVLIVAHDYVVRLLTEYLLEFRAATEDGKKAARPPAKNFYGAEVPPASITELMVSLEDELVKTSGAGGDPGQAIADVVLLRSCDVAHLAAKA